MELSRGNLGLAGGGGDSRVFREKVFVVCSQRGGDGGRLGRGMLLLSSKRSSLLPYALASDRIVSVGIDRRGRILLLPGFVVWMVGVRLCGFFWGGSVVVCFVSGDISLFWDGNCVYICVIFIRAVCMGCLVLC